jgi:hypothetical protein
MRSLSYAIPFALMLAACGGGGSTNPTIDAPNNTVHDAPSVTPDAPATAVTGLGQKCGTGLPACPTASPTCLTLQGAATGFCSGVCHMAATFTTDAQGAIASTTVVAADDSKCTAIYSATVGTPICGLEVNVMPTPTNPIQKSTTFTFDAYCGVKCGTGNTCPTGMTCNTTQMLCTPS